MSPTLVAPAERVARVTPGAPDHISPTAAKSYLNCSLRFYFERVIVAHLIDIDCGCQTDVG